MHEILFGGITFQFYDEETDQVGEDAAFPFENDITAVSIDADGNYHQTYLGEFPKLFDLDGNRLRFGANAEFFAEDDLVSFSNGVIDFDQLGQEMVLGHIFGGIVANAPHTRSDPAALSAGSNRVFEVVLTRVPEPSSLVLVASIGLSFALSRSYRLRRA